MKKVLIGVGIVVVLLAVAFIYLNNRNRTLSPPGDASLNVEGMTLNVNYSRPSVRDRMIFGYEEEGALQPYGIYWRLGANEPTFLEVTEAFMFGGESFEAGKYVIYAIPRKGEMEIRLSSDLRWWGYFEPDYSMDLATEIVRMQPNEHTEQFTIDIEPLSNGATLIFRWSNQRWELPIEKQ